MSRLPYISYSEGKLSIDLAALLDHMGDEDKRHLCEALSCESEVIRHVTAQILDGWTENGQHGATLCTASPDPTPCHGLDWAKREVARRAGEVAAKEIARLEAALKYSEERFNAESIENHSLRASLRGRDRYGG